MAFPLRDSDREVFFHEIGVIPRLYNIVAASVKVLGSHCKYRSSKQSKSRVRFAKKKIATTLSTATATKAWCDAVKLNLVLHCLAVIFDHHVTSASDVHKRSVQYSFTSWFHAFTSAIRTYKEHVRHSTRRSAGRKL